MISFEVSSATIEDLPLLVLHRQSMWHDMHPELASEIADSEESTRDWIKDRLSDGRLVGFIARATDHRVVGSGCIWTRDEQPRPTNRMQKVPYLMSMYTVKEFRRNGVAKAIVRKAIEWSKERGYDRVVLHASDQGRLLYEGLGFEPGREMRLKF